MSYVEKNLLPGETVEYRAHLHPVIYLQSAFFGLIGLAFVIFGLVNQSILGRVLNFGTIVVTGTGTNEPFTSIANPLEFRRRVQARTSG